MTSLTYQIPIPEELYGPAENLLKITKTFANVLIATYWAEENIEALDAWRGKKYKFFGDKNFAKGHCYLPSRIRRGILELVGEVIAGHAERMRVYKRILENIKGGKDPLEGVKNKELGQNVWRWIRNMAKKFSPPEKYTHATIPIIRRPVFLYYPDDGQAIQITYKNGEITVRIKLPENTRPSRKDWKWHTFRYQPKGRLRELLEGGARIRKPRLRMIRVASGAKKYVLDIVLEVEDKPTKGSERLLAVDLGVRKIATLVLMDTGGDQLSRPIFIRSNLLGKLLRIKRKISAIQRKLDRLKPMLAKLPSKKVEYYRRLEAELIHNWKKIRRIIRQIQHYVSTTIVRLALVFDADIIVFEDLRSYKPPSDRGELSWVLSTAFMRLIIELTRYKALRHGIRTALVDPRNTSHFCPRCGGHGFAIRSPRDLTPHNSGGFFFCPSCGFMGDRDYVGALNVGRAFILGGRLVLGGKGSRYMPLPNPTGGRSLVGALPALVSAPIFLSPVGGWEGWGRLSDCHHLALNGTKVT